ncbi:MAG: nucleotidyl transferase AbiEii/AbiGii toxin family protein [Gemmatimonadetes bacterium]|nr:nucleotidyl transferase AbiEii/AbiGii toxin family protein [Gemmatimonadota bacterium]
MRYQTAAALRAALEERLRQRAQTTGRSLSRLRKQVVFDRLLARLVQAAPGRWILKGAVALDLRLPARSRATKDMDVGRSDGEAHATADLLAATALELPDFFVFRSERARDLDEVPEGAAVRYRVRAELAGRLFEEVILDAGFSHGTLPPADTVRSFDYLEFAGLPLVEVPVIPLARHVAEKVHAYARTYGEGRASTRVKDLVDLVLRTRPHPPEPEDG